MSHGTGGLTMDRLTKKEKYGIDIICENCPYHGICADTSDCLNVVSEKLFAYEDTGLTPEQVKAQQWISVKDRLPENEEDAAPVVHGRWIKAVAYDFAGSLEGYKCNICGRFCTDNAEPYCHCGAKMDGKDDAK
jgi:hypothetical protein